MTWMIACNIDCQWRMRQRVDSTFIESLRRCSWHLETLNFTKVVHYIVSTMIKIMWAIDRSNERSMHESSNRCMNVPVTDGAPPENEGAWMLLSFTCPSMYAAYSWLAAVVCSKILALGNRVHALSMKSSRVSSDMMSKDQGFPHIKNWCHFKPSCGTPTSMFFQTNKIVPVMIIIMMPEYCQSLSQWHLWVVIIAVCRNK